MLSPSVGGPDQDLGEEEEQSADDEEEEEEEELGEEEEEEGDGEEIVAGSHEEDAATAERVASGWGAAVAHIAGVGAAPSPPHPHGESWWPSSPPLLSPLTT